METELFVLSHLLLLSSRQALPFLYRREVGGREVERNQLVAAGDSHFHPSLQRPLVAFAET